MFAYILYTHYFSITVSISLVDIFMFKQHCLLSLATLSSSFVSCTKINHDVDKSEGTIVHNSLKSLSRGVG